MELGPKNAVCTVVSHPPPIVLTEKGGCGGAPECGTEWTCRMSLMLFSSSQLRTGHSTVFDRLARATFRMSALRPPHRDTRAKKLSRFVHAAPKGNLATS